MEFDAISKFVCADKGQKFVPGQCCGMHEKVSVLSCMSASGTSLPHLFIYKSLSGKIPKYVSDRVEESTMFQDQKSGWMLKDIPQMVSGAVSKVCPSRMTFAAVIQWFKCACHHRTNRSC